MNFFTILQTFDTHDPSTYQTAANPENLRLELLLRVHIFPAHFLGAILSGLVLRVRGAGANFTKFSEDRDPLKSLKSLFYISNMLLLFLNQTHLKAKLRTFYPSVNIRERMD